MSISDIVTLYEEGKLQNNCFYGYCFSLNKRKILSVHHEHYATTAFVIDSKTKFCDTLDGSKREYFLTPKEAVEYAIQCCNRSIEREKKQIEYLTNMKKKL